MTTSNATEYKILGSKSIYACAVCLLLGFASLFFPGTFGTLLVIACWLVATQVSYYAGRREQIRRDRTNR